MSPEKLVMMANQIATFFKSQPGNDQAERVAGHLQDFWDPRMRRQFRDYVENGGENVDDIARKAAQLLA
ncbi:MAG: formate dehydrogenase subunit delta [Roseovarius sp.]